jgi:thioredoxin-like negative regulator of GroEL
MERVTYPSKKVQIELTRRYERVVLDLEEDAETATRFRPEAIPVAVILDASGAEIARRVGFVPPEEYSNWLASHSP